MENVWDFPRPPAVVPCERRVRIEVGGLTIADSPAALRVLETSHPPTIYIPPGDVLARALTPARGRGSFCEFKGHARYLDVVVPGERRERVAWTYPDPSTDFAELRDHIAFYPGRVDAAWLDDERVTAQEGDFYGGWVTRDLIGPFKGPPGTTGW